MISEQSHYRISAGVLADWLERQTDPSWWSVDGDPILTERLNFPCTHDELAGALRAIGQPLLLLSSDLDAATVSREVNADDVDRIAIVDTSGNRVLQLCWAHVKPEVDWLLCEDIGVSEFSDRLPAKS